VKKKPRVKKNDLAGDGRFLPAEIGIASEAGANDHRAGLKRATNPFTFPALRVSWELGWRNDQRICRNEYQRRYRARRKGSCS